MKVCDECRKQIPEDVVYPNTGKVEVSFWSGYSPEFCNEDCLLKWLKKRKR